MSFKYGVRLIVIIIIVEKGLRIVGGFLLQGHARRPKWK